jgi:zinc-ribbon domain
MFEDDLRYAVYVFLGGVFSVIAISRELAIGLFISVAAYCALSGFYILLFDSGEKRSYSYAQARQPERISPTTSAPITDEPTIADRIKEIHVKNDFKCPSCGATVQPTDIKCKHCGSILVAAANLPRPGRWADIEIGQPIELKHPKLGELHRSVVHRIYYGELWQAQMKQNVPWTLTGSYYAGLGLGDNMLLINWQSRFYVLDSKSPLTDMEINQRFAKAAREFAASNQTKYVTFILDTVWRMEDIGRFRIEYAEGEGISVSPGAVGRFIHASHDDRVLVVEDYQTGGNGLDTLWQGYHIEEQEIKL